MSPHVSRIPFCCGGWRSPGRSPCRCRCSWDVSDQFVIGTWGGTIGADFFRCRRLDQPPPRRRHLFQGRQSRPWSEHLSHGGRRLRPHLRLWYPYHPALSVAVGSVDVAAAAGGQLPGLRLFLLVRSLAQCSPGRPARAGRSGQGLGVFRGFAGGPPTSCLERAMHVFTVLAEACLLAGLVDATDGKGKGTRGTPFAGTACEGALHKMPAPSSALARSWRRPGC